MKTKKLYLVLLIGLLLIVGCGKKEEIEIKGNVISLAYSYSSTKGQYRDYKVQLIDDNVTLYSYGNDTVSENTTKNVDKKYMDELESLVDKYKIKDWNGFNEQKNADEGVGFSLEIGFSDGNNITATGFVNYPEGYESFQNEFINFYNSMQ